MKIVEEKLERFGSDIMADVEKKRQEIIKNAEEIYKDKFGKAETKYLTWAYNYIQNEMKKIDKEKNEIISKATMDSKTNLLNKRIEIIESVFSKVREELKVFTKSEEYYDYLFDMIKSAIQITGEGEVLIYINHSDEALLQKLNEAFNNRVKLEDKKIEMIGGCKVLNKDKNIFLDDSFEKRLEDQRETFLKQCKINIDLN